MHLSLCLLTTGAMWPAPSGVSTMVTPLPRWTEAWHCEPKQSPSPLSWFNQYFLTITERRVRQSLSVGTVLRTIPRASHSSPLKPLKLAFPVMPILRNVGLCSSSLLSLSLSGTCYINGYLPSSRAAVPLTASSPRIIRQTDLRCKQREKPRLSSSKLWLYMTFDVHRAFSCNQFKNEMTLLL